MGCQKSVELGNNLTFTVITHDPDTGVVTDADSLPTYRVYEDETSTPIATGTMAKLDDANTTGFYSQQLACTAGAGYEVGKSYTIYVEATVDGDTGAVPMSFTVTAPTVTTSVAGGDFDQDAVDAVIGDLLADPQVDYRIGDKEFKNSQKMELALAARKALAETPSVQLGFVQFHQDIDVMGDDDTEVAVL